MTTVNNEYRPQKQNRHFTNTLNKLEIKFAKRKYRQTFPSRRTTIQAVGIDAIVTVLAAELTFTERCVGQHSSKQPFSYCTSVQK